MTTWLDRESQLYLEDTVEVVRTILDEHPGDRQYLVLEVEGEIAARSGQRTWLRVVSDRDGMMAETPGFPVRAGSLVAGPGVDPVFRWIEAEGGRVFLGMVRRMPERLGPGMRIEALLDTSRTAGLLADFRLALVVMIVAGAVMACGAGMAMTRAGLHPLRQIGRILHRITASRLSERIGTTRWPAELREIAAAFDSMLERLEEGFARISQFSDDMAHELRTPIANMRGEMGVALSRSRTVDELQQVLASGLEELERLGAMVDGMLFLARSDEPHRLIEKRQLPLAGEVDEVLTLYEALAESSRLRFAVDVEGGVTADPELLRRALGNLVANAIRHTPPEGTIRIHGRGGHGGPTRIAVEDDGPGIPPEALPRIFERFYRVDRARGVGSGGAGLGLSIVKRIMELHGGRVEVSSPPGRGARFVLEFPPPGGTHPAPLPDAPTRPPA